MSREGTVHGSLTIDRSIKAAFMQHVVAETGSTKKFSEHLELAMQEHMQKESVKENAHAPKHTPQPTQHPRFVKRDGQWVPDYK